MQNIILVAGYTKQEHLEIIRGCFSSENIVLGCAYHREPKTDSKYEYLQKFDVLFDLKQPADIEKLQYQAENVLLVTCTQERDMEAYIESLALCGKISEEQKQLYIAAVDKHTFKAELSKTHPELVPGAHVVDDALLQKLDTLSYPQVIKPSGLAGSILVRIVDSPEMFKTHIDSFAESMCTIATDSYEKSVDVITEEYISGPQYSVNVYINAKQEITFCPISRVITPQEMGQDDSYSALQYTTDELDNQTLDALYEGVKKVVQHFDIRSTSAHFDSVLHASGWKFFEIGLRIGGKRQELYTLSHGMNHFKNDILNRLGRPTVIPSQKNTVCIVQKAAVTEGTLNNISYTRTIQTEKPPLIKEDKMAKAGNVVMPLSHGGGTISRHFVWGKDHTEVVEAGKTLFHSINFDIT
ncbi:MAG: hypothetical protein ACI9VM_000475 [Candidatus Azotimanducaceae bacterium]|jgi:hypothetical protein